MNLTPSVIEALSRPDATDAHEHDAKDHSKRIGLHRRRLQRIIADVDACKNENNGKSERYIAFCFNFIRSLEALLNAPDDSLLIFLRELATQTTHPVFELALNAAADKIERDTLPPSLR